MEVRPIGLLEMTDQGVLDEKVLAVGKNNPRYRDVWNYSEIYPHMLKEITHFFSIYKDLEGSGWRSGLAGCRVCTRSVMYAVRNFVDSKQKKVLELRGRAVGLFSGAGGGGFLGDRGNFSAGWGGNVCLLRRAFWGGRGAVELTGFCGALTRSVVRR